MLCLQAANERAREQTRNLIAGVWLNGRLSGMADPKTYPALEDLLDDGVEPELEGETETGTENIGAKLWIMFLNRR